MTWEKWDQGYWYHVKTLNDDVWVSSPEYVMGKIKLTFWVGFVLFWYFDHVFPSNRGAASPPYFMFLPSYWQTVFPCLKKGKESQTDQEKKKDKQKKRVIKEKDIMAVDKDSTFKSVQTEKERVLYDEDNDIVAQGIRIVGIEKIYFKLPFGLKSEKDVHAVKDVFMNIDRNELLCLLGHNGAGKSTLFNMLTGILGPTEGYAKICGLDIRTDQE